MVLLAIRCPSELLYRSVTGAVTDLEGNPLPTAVVQLENDFDLSIRSYITGADGRYHFSQVRADIDYTLRAHTRNRWSKPKTLSRFNSSSRPEIRLVIPID
jgi:protocatechuate 3,4-dioxygenase beta subunit